ncbi:unnamed protein product [Nesidiocoris tenuis]|uniref:C2H2-type domain-containing protein n=1 Tax=Nesidiocoris tenuis TaxID=355587 RepID=A0A6H5HDG4_9HEMI|nr:unnamed protein product [Nesidiocoris tenuis]
MTLNMTCPLCCQRGFSSAESLCSALVSAATRKLNCPVCNETVVGLDKLTIHLLGHVASNVANPPNNVPHPPTILERLGSASENALAPNPVLYFTSDSGDLYALATDAVVNRTNLVATNSANCAPTNEIANGVQCRKRLSTESADGGKFSSCKELLTSGDFSVANEENDSPSNNENLAGTVQMQPGSSAQSVTCNVCDQSFSNVAILAVHKQLTHTAGSKKLDAQKACEKSKKRPLLCKWCPSTFNLRSSLLAHIKVTHPGQKDESQPRKESEKLSCQICGKPCSKVSLYYVSCIFCRKIEHRWRINLYVFQEGALHQHMKMAHGEKPWQCPVCSKTFTTKYFLRKHKRIHTGETPYECSICHKVFTFQQSYHKHMLYHTDNKPYCCSHCGRLFKELSTLNNHERIHSGEKPFACENCGKAFRQRVSYLVHRRIHTGAMPYQCTACNKSFRYKISQRTHKCAAQPPGVVVKTQDSLVARLQAVISKVSSH